MNINTLLSEYRSACELQTQIRKDFIQAGIAARPNKLSQMELEQVQKDIKEAATLVAEAWRELEAHCLQNGLDISEVLSCK